MIDCKDQAEVDYYWDKLTADGGEPSQCGWLKDKYGLSWQIITPGWDKMLLDKDPKKSERVMKAILTMGKPDLKAIKQAYEGH